MGIFDFFNQDDENSPELTQLQQEAEAQRKANDTGPYKSDAPTAKWNQDALHAEQDSVKGPPRSLAMDPAVAEHVAKQDPSLWERYQKMAADTQKDVEATRASANRRRMGLGIAQGLASYGGANVDVEPYRKDQDARESAADGDRKNKLGDLLTQDKLKYQDVERDRAAQKFDREKAEWGQQDTEFGNKQEKFGWDKVNNDPNSNAARSAALVTAKEFGVDPKLMDGLSFDQIKELRLQKKEQGAAKAHLILTPIEQDGKTQLAWADPNTGEIKPTGILKGFAQGIGPEGNAFSKSDPSKATPVTVVGGKDDGKPLADARVGFKEESAHAAETGKQQAKDEQGAQEATERVTTTKEFTDRMRQLRQGAKHEGPLGDNTGPVMGRVAKAVNDFGYSMGPNTDRAIADMNREAQRYVVQMTGLTSTDPQFNRLMENMPTLAKDDGAYEAKLQSWLDDVQRVADEKGRIAGNKQPAPTTSQQPAATSKPSWAK